MCWRRKEASIKSKDDGPHLAGGQKSQFKNPLIGSTYYNNIAYRFVHRLIFKHHKIINFMKLIPPAD